MKIDDEFQDRDNRMRYTMMRPHDNFWNNQKPRTSWDGRIRTHIYLILCRRRGPDITIRNGQQSVRWKIKRRL